MKIYSRDLLACFFLLLVGVAPASAAITFYADQAAFDAASTTSILDFEGLVSGDGGWSMQGEHVISDVTFTTNPFISSGSLICGKLVCGGNPYDSALIAANFDYALVADFSLLTSPVTAVGGIFGDLNGPVGPGTFSIFGATGLLGTYDVTVGSMGAGLAHTFFGWTTTGGDEITKLEFLVQDGSWAGADNFQFGTEGVTVVPLPAALPLFSSALLGFGFILRKRKNIF